MQQGTLASERLIRVYLAVLDDVVLRLRMRIRDGEQVDLHEVHDLMDAIHNIPPMLCAYGDWNVEANIHADLARYDERWFKADSDSLRSSLMKTLTGAEVK